MEEIAYEYRNCPIPGGGFVTGLLFERDREVLYARTDIGGLYRRDFKEGSWVPLNDDVTSEELSLTYPLSIAVDTGKVGSLYAVCGRRRGMHGYFAVSCDGGENFTLKPLPCPVHGNMPGRSTGERLVCENGSVYFASQSAGLWYSPDEGDTWEQLPVRDFGEGEEKGGGSKGSAAEQNLTFLWKKNDLLVVGCNGAANRVSENMRGTVLYLSYDAGEHFRKMPAPCSAGGFEGIAGFVPQHFCYDGEFLYVTFMETEGRHYAGFDSYSFDTGSCRDGRVWRYRFAGREVTTQDVTPCGRRLVTEGFSDAARAELGGLVPPEYLKNDFGKEPGGMNIRMLSGGISGIDFCSGLLLCSTGSIKGADAVFASTDAGEHWLPVLCGLSVGNFCPDKVSYMKAEYNGGNSILHWLSDIRINPHHPDEAYVTTGTGVFRLTGLDRVRGMLSAGIHAPHQEGVDSGGDKSRKSGGILPDRLVTCVPDCAGIEETVHLNVYSLPRGAVRVVDIVGDLGGFCFTDVSKQCENSFADAKNDRYITCLNADFPEQYPNMLVTGARGNWSGRTKGGALLSYDQGLHFIHLPYPEGISEKLDACIARVRCPNMNAGYVAITADGSRVLWAVAGQRGFASDCVVYMDIAAGAAYSEAVGERDVFGTKESVREDARREDVWVGQWQRGREQEVQKAPFCGLWYASRFYDRAGNRLSEPVYIHPYADRVNPHLMYAFADGGRIFLSSDRGGSFYETERPEGFPASLFSHWSIHCQVTVDYGEEGVLYLAVQEAGLYRLRLQEGAVVRWELARLTAAGDYARCVGLGCAGEGKIIYIAGRIEKNYGFYRSLDGGRSWERINRRDQMFGEIRAVCGDRREAGVFYLATGSRGLLCGKPKK